MTYTLLLVYHRTDNIFRNRNHNINFTILFGMLYELIPAHKQWQPV